MKLRCLAAALVLIVAGSPVLAADAGTAELQRCRGIADDAARLSCYDALTAPATAAPAAKPAEFGAEAIQRKSDTEPPASLRARLPGHFETLKKGDRYKLDNGQIWLNIHDREITLDADDPEVTITRNFIGSYWMKLDSRGSQIRVRRIQ
jgi:hypothetical protein